MPDYRYKNLPFVVLPDDNLIAVKARGSLLFEDLVGHVEDFMQHEDFYAGMHLVYDISEVDSLSGELQTLLETVESLNCPDFIPVQAKTVFYTGENDKAARVLEGFCIMTRYTRVPHFIASDMNNMFEILGMHPIENLFGNLFVQKNT